MRVLIVGYGYMGEIRHRVAQDLKRIEVTAIVDPHKAGQDVGGLRIEEDFEAVLMRERPDIVFVCTPNNLIAEYTVKSLEAGCHVFAEKPPGRNVADVERMRAAEARFSGQKLMFGFNHRHHPAVQDARRIVQSGELGRLLWLRGVYGKSGGMGRGFEKSWRNDPVVSGGGILIDQGIHMLDLFRYFAGEFEAVEGWLTTSYWNVAVEDNAWVHLRTGQGVVAQLHSSATLWKHTFQIELGLAEGYLSIRGLLSKTGSYGRETLVIGRKAAEGGRGAVGNPPEETVYYDHDPSWHVQVEDFIRCIDEGVAVHDSTSLDALRVMELVERVYRDESVMRASEKPGAMIEEPVEVEAPRLGRTVVVEPEVHELEIRPETATQRFRERLMEEAGVLYADGSCLMLVPCPACAGGTHQDLFEIGGARYSSCRGCGTWFVGFRPRAEVWWHWHEVSAARAILTNEVFKGSAAARLEHVSKPRARWVRRSLELAELPFEATLVGEDDLFMEDTLREAGVEVVDSARAVLWFERLDRSVDPAEELCRIGSALGKEGIVLSTAFLCSGFDVSILRERHPSLNPLERMNVYTEKGLRLLAGRCGFEITEFSTPGTMDLEIVRRTGIAEGALGSFAKVLVDGIDGNVGHDFTEFLQANRLSSFARLAMRVAR